MGSLKKGLDKFDLGTPLLAQMLGGTADYGEGVEEQEEVARQLDKTNTQARTAPGKRRARGVIT